MGHSLRFLFCHYPGPFLAATLTLIFFLRPGTVPDRAFYWFFPTRSPELNEPARPTAAPTAARPVTVSRDTGGPVPGERRADRATG